MIKPTDDEGKARGLLYHKRDVVVRHIRRWMVEGQFDVTSAAAPSDPRPLVDLTPLLTPAPSPVVTPCINRRVGVNPVQML
eukprot:m.299711 g.299711  ORF g.299711 m.299711 type:complete len:81 (+) comp16300_c0_seq1:611-853(+)